MLNTTISITEDIGVPSRVVTDFSVEAHSTVQLLLRSNIGSIKLNLNCVNVIMCEYNMHPRTVTI